MTVQEFDATPTTLQSVFHALNENSYLFTPIKRGEKRPLLKSWSKTNSNNSQWIAQHPDAGVGIVLDDDLVAFDFDILDTELSAIVISLFESNPLFQTAPCRIGREPKRLYLFRVENPFTKAKLKFSPENDFIDAKGKSIQQALEILGKGQQVVAYGIHPDTNKNYAWITANQPINQCKESLPLLTHEQIFDFLKILQQKFKELEIKTMLDGVPNSEGLRQKTVTAKKTVCEPVEVTQVNTTTADTAGIASTEWECMPLFHREEFSSALSVLPNFERQAWLKVGMSIHSMDHTQNGFELWDNWSKSCTDKYDSQTQAQVWFSFKTKRDKKRNKESVFYDARELDWKPDFEKTHYAASQGLVLPKIIGDQIKKNGANQLIILGVDKTSCLTIHAAFNEKYPIAVCVDNDGLNIVATQLREIYPKLRILIAGNSNALDEYDTGRKKAQAACYNKNSLIGGIKFVTPNFKAVTEVEVKAAFDSRPAGTTQSAVLDELKAERLKKYETAEPTPTSFDDLASWAGIEAVKSQIESVINRMGVIYCEGGEQPKILIEIEAEMNFDAANLFQRAGQLVRTIHIEKELEQGGMKMHANTLTIHLINEAWLANYWTSILQFKKFDVRSHKYNRIDAPLKYATTYFS